MLETGSELLVEPLARPECLSTAEVAECACPDFCERDHDND
jgi:hypothetical protein